ncbi:MAG TPA: hypothetical protein VM008_19580 [Phycisphaerae bacterium]|nr:hypothetical protein [Phycisphaerae bacterium]
MTVFPPMNEPDKADVLISAHLQKKLDTQRGRAGAAFREKMRREGEGEAGTHSLERARRQSVRMLRVWAGTASALAACLAMVVTIQFLRQQSAGGVTAPARSIPVQQASVGVMDQVELSREVDGGTRILEDQTPVRVVREEQLRQTQWFDPSEKATYQMTEPIEKVGYVRIQPY